MRLTRFALQSASTISRNEASKFVSQVAERSSAKSRPRRSRKFWDFAVLGVATIAAATSLQRRREYEAEHRIMEAKMSLICEERDQAVDALKVVQETLVNDANAGVATVLASRSNRTERLTQWIVSAFDDAQTKTEEKASTEKPQMI